MDTQQQAPSAGWQGVGGEKMYVGRVELWGDLLPGKVVPSHGACYASCGGNEIAYTCAGPSHAQFAGEHSPSDRVRLPGMLPGLQSGSQSNRHAIKRTPVATGVIAASQVLVTDDYSLVWRPASRGAVPPGAVRAEHQGSLTVGKVHLSHRCLYIPFGGSEHRYTEYEVLVYHTC
ncbi:uncharacterized protein LOC144110545 [Amblyomma americanum]